MLVADGACFTRILSFLFESNALLVYASYRQNRRELRLACCVIEGLKGVECWWLKAKWLEHSGSITGLYAAACKVSICHSIALTKIVRIAALLDSLGGWISDVNYSLNSLKGVIWGII